MRIMLCYDGTDLAASAIPVTRMLAEHSGAEVQLVRMLHVSPHRGASSADAISPTIGSGGAVAADLHRVAAERRWAAEADAYERDLRDAIRAARAECETVLRELPQGATIHVGTTEGDVAEALITHARDWAPDLIVMAAHSRSPVKELFLGSVSRAVLASGVAPVTLIHPQR